MAIKSGLRNIVLAGGVEKMNDLPTERRQYWLGVSGDTEWERVAGATFPGIYAAIATRHMHQYGTTREQLALCAVKNHYNGSLNPKAQFRRAVSVEKVLNSPMVAHPLSIYDCCSITDGASVVILCNGALARKYTDTPVWVAGSGAGTDYLALHDRLDITSFMAARVAANQAFNMADLEPKNIDFAEVHDCFTIAEILAYEDLGFCDKGEGGKLLEEGVTKLDGSLPVNASGGLKAKGHPLGATGTAQIYELFHQLRGTAEEPARQLSDVEVGLAHNVGGSGATCVVHILRR
jgi:acetyl-CoA C-acetyltransferase/acetyl-CoA acyltransferase